MKYLNTSLGFCISIIFISGCVVYYPHTPDIPSVSEKKELILDGGISLIPAIEGTMNYGISDKIAIQAYGNLDGDYRYLFQSALGFYKEDQHGNINSLYFGIGHGKAEYSKMPNYHCKGNYQMYYVQPNYVFRSSKWHFFEAGLGIKAGILNTHLNTIDEYSIQRSSYDNDNSLLFEPSLCIKIGGDRFKVNLKTSWCYVKSFTNGADINFWPYGNIGLSLNYRFKI